MSNHPQAASSSRLVPVVPGDLKVLMAGKHHQWHEGGSVAHVEGYWVGWERVVEAYRLGDQEQQLEWWERVVVVPVGRQQQNHQQTHLCRLAVVR
jgi:hypothetical protein